MISLLLAGGPFMFATLAASILIIGIFIWRVFYFWGGGGVGSRSFLNQVVGLIEAQNITSAIRACSEARGPLANILKSALMRANRSEREIRRAVESAALEEIPKVKGGTVFLPQMSNLATLLGLIGTIHGLIISFEGAAAGDAATRQAVMSQGIAIAFYNTFFGLTVATIGVVLYLLLLGKMNATLAFIEESASSVIDTVLWHRERHDE